MPPGSPRRPTRDTPWGELALGTGTASAIAGQRPVQPDRAQQVQRQLSADQCSSVAAAYPPGGVVVEPPDDVDEDVERTAGGDAVGHRGDTLDGRGVRGDERTGSGWSRGRVRAVVHTCAPIPRNRAATAAPAPSVPPVTSARRPSSRSSCPASGTVVRDHELGHAVAAQREPVVQVGDPAGEGALQVHRDHPVVRRRRARPRSARSCTRTRSRRRGRRRGPRRGRGRSRPGRRRRRRRWGGRVGVGVRRGQP